MQLPKKDTTLVNDEPVFKPIRGLQTAYVDLRNSWSKPSHLPAQPSLNPSTTDSLPANHNPSPPSPITPSKPTTAITIPPTHLPPTPSPTPTRNLKRSYSSLIEVRLPNQTPHEKKATTSPLHQSANQKSSPPSSPSIRPTKRPRQTPTTSLRPTSLFPSHNPLTPPFSIRYRHPPPPSEPPISALELKRAAESILRQVDWDIVAEDVASNRQRGVFRKVVRSVLQEGVDALGGR